MDNNGYNTEYGENNGIQPELSVAGGAASEPASAAPKKKQVSRMADLYDWVDTFCYALAIMIMLFVFVFRYVTVDGNSMMNTLHDGDRLIISDVCYTPKTGDIVVIYIEGQNKPYIKRVIATGGQRVRIDFNTWQVWVDGELLDEDYVLRTEGDMNYASFYNGEFTVPEGQIYVMGDNRNDSRDSRVIGCLEEHNIIGRVIIRLFPAFGKVN